MPLHKYYIKFRKSPKAKLQTWERFAHNSMEARASARKALNKEYDNAKLIAVIRA